MGQKVNPHGLRVGVIKNWDSRWYAPDEKFGDTLVQDYKIRKYIKKTLFKAGVPAVEIERDNTGKVTIYIHCAKPGVAIGRGGENIDKINKSFKLMVFSQGGPTDIAYNNCKNTLKVLDEAGLKYDYMENAQAGHSWGTWREDLRVLAQRIFK